MVQRFNGHAVHMELRETFCPVNGEWTGIHYGGDLGPSDPVCDSCNTLLEDEDMTRLSDLLPVLAGKLERRARR